MSNYQWTGLGFRYFCRQIHTWRQVYEVSWQNLSTTHSSFEWLEKIRVSQHSSYIESGCLKLPMHVLYVVPVSSKYTKLSWTSCPAQSRCNAFSCQSSSLPDALFVKWLFYCFYSLCIRDNCVQGFNIKR